MNQQDYCNLIENYINSIYGKTWTKKFTLDDVFNYCIKRTEVLNENDEEKILELVKEVLETLVRIGKLSFYKNKFKVECPILKDDDIRIFQQPPRITNVNQSIIDTIDEIDKNTTYLGDN